MNGPCVLSRNRSDRWIGGIVGENKDRNSGKNGTLPEGSRILVVLLGRIGDVIFTLPSIIALKTVRPDIRVDWVVEDRCSDLLLNHPDIDRLIIFPRSEFEDLFRKGKWGDAFGVLRDLIRNIRSERYQAVLDFQGLLKSGLLTGLSRSQIKLGSPSTYGKMKEGSGFFSRQVPLDGTARHLVDRHFLVIKHLLGDIPFSRLFYLRIEEEEKKRVKKTLASIGWVSGPAGNEDGPFVPFVLIHPFASWETRQWPMDKFVSVARHFLGKDFRVGIVGGGGKLQEQLLEPFFRLQRETIAEKTGIKNRVEFFPGTFSLRELAFLMQRSSLVLTDDSGPMHLSAAVGARTLGIFGPTDPVRLGPSYGVQCMSVHRSLLCQPCMKRRCPIGTLCMNELLPDQVIREAESLLNIPSAGFERNGLIGATKTDSDH